ncbi:alpha/beta-hydrolase [Piromyces finnis]|uniref:Carboxylic ester hydrolase n=1 Tax=Piromyces finnis TaxID=1754191 RepID=A0A1Y1UZL4_9FUNG|nr:alpha/beta-hydrolase [Piromyces finnis]|eukprot:ORX44166.1 alpha/beta-hydrolase [Piromyces finnis]
MMHPENVSESSNLLTHAAEYNFSSSDSDIEEIPEAEEDFGVSAMPTMKEKEKKRNSHLCLGFLLVLILIGIGIVFIFFSPQKFRFKINENSSSDSKTLYSFDFNTNKPIEGTYNKTLSVSCKNGIFVGEKTDDDILSFKGIPYAKPPTGKLRWKPPVRPDDSLTVMEAYHFGYSPIQTQWALEAASYYEQSEDCLTLNIWVNPTEKYNGKKPVMVFIYGGSYGWGGTIDPMYDAYHFVKDQPDIVFVTVNYRTGIMGFIDFSKVEGGEEYKESGNLGLLDQIQALKWIKENIEGFGGDPDNVTLFGESAGAGSVSILSVIPEAKGLFKRVIAQSGSVALTYSKKECQKLTELLLKEANADTMNDLLTLTEDTLKEINIKLNDYNNFPERDGIVIPEDLYEVYQNGTSKDIDFLIGNHQDESRYWIRAFGNEYIYQMAVPILYENNMKEVSDDDKESAEKFVRLQKSTYPWSISKFYNELLFRIPAMEQAIGHSKNGGNVYMYYWTYPVSYKKIGAHHGVELSFVMDNLNQTVFSSHLANKELASSVQEMWVNFAKTGQPSVGNITWEKFEPDTKRTMILNENYEMKDHVLEEQYILIKPLLKYNFNGCYTDLNYNVNYVQKVIIGSICILIAIIILPIIICKKK